MADGQFGGDGSVKVFIHVNHRKQPNGTSLPHSDTFVDGVVDGLDFTITIKLPQSAGDIGGTLANAVRPFAGQQVTLIIPVEPHNDTNGNWPQIKVEWPDTPPSLT